MRTRSSAFTTSESAQSPWRGKHEGRYISSGAGTAPLARCRRHPVNMLRFFSSSTTGGLCVGKAATRPQISHIGAGGDGGANKEADAAASASSTAHQIVTASLIRSRASSIWPCRATAESVSREREGGWEGGGGMDGVRSRGSPRRSRQLWPRRRAWGCWWCSRR